MNIVIVGQGAIGLLLYCQLSKVDTVNVSLKCSNSVTNPPSHISFTDYQQNTQQITLNIANNDQLKQADLVIYCLKAYALLAELKKSSRYFSSSTPLVLCHNGMISLNELPKALLNKQPILTMLTSHGCKKVADFTIHHTGEGYSDIGLASGDLTISQQKQIIYVLNKGIKKLFWQENIKQQQWLKLAINCVINPLTALHNIDNGLILSKGFEKKIDKIINEVVLVAQSQEVTFDIPELKQIIKNVARLTANNRSSMRTDILMEKQTEIDHINGFIHQLAKSENIATPENTLLWQKIKQLENNYLLH